MATKKLSGQQKVQKALESGKVLTPGLIKTRYKLKNPHQQVFYLENVMGITVKRQYTKLKNGRRTVKYSM